MSKAFHEIRLPEDISYGAQGGPSYDVDIVTSKGKREQRNLNSQEGLCLYNVGYGVRSLAQYTALLSFFRARKGKTYGFRYKDWLDYTATNQTIGSADGSTNIYQLIKTYEDAYGTDTREIKKPVSGTLKVYVDGNVVTDYVCDYTTGIITFASFHGTALAPKIVTADFEFDVPCRFDIEQMAASYTEFQNVTWESITLVELILD